MISTLHIKNIGIIDELTIDLNNGFNVFTGETGAGKTLIIDSLCILAGGRFSKEIMRYGESNSFVEMSLFLPNKGYEDDTVIVSREVNITGKNTCKINGRLVTVSELKNFMKSVIDIHGQNDNQSILDVSTHIDLLDEFANSEIKDVKNEYLDLYEQYIDIKNELSKNYGDDREKQRKLDLLNYQIIEIEEANLKADEEEELEEKRKILMSFEKISANLKEADNYLSRTVIDGLENAIRNLEHIESFKAEYSKIAQNLRSSYYEIEEAAREISIYANQDDFDENELFEIDERLNLIKTLKRKYGNTIIEILNYKEQIIKEKSEIENLEDYIIKLKADLKNVENKLEEKASKMNLIRNKYAKELAERVNKELVDVEMKNSKFEVAIEKIGNNRFSKNGLDEIEFMISTNIGEEKKSLAKIASGGEMSRFMLVLKNVLADVDKIPVLIFDEIDTGISGNAAVSCGEKIKQIAKSHQVICITHQPSIAAKGDYNYFISKEVKENKTRTKIKKLTEEETIKEIARIASGNVSEISLKHAKELRGNKVA
ncbi:MAG: DNA repair protein RecN [Clostridia bacterium]|nr:DNA repair protein RecN [Clostridia bacterium]